MNNNKIFKRVETLFLKRMARPTIKSFLRKLTCKTIMCQQWGLHIVWHIYRNTYCVFA